MNNLLCILFGHISLDDVDWDDDKIEAFLEEYPEEEYGVRCVRCGKPLQLFY